MKCWIWMQSKFSVNIFRDDKFCEEVLIALQCFIGWEMWAMEVGLFVVGAIYINFNKFNKAGVESGYGEVSATRKHFVLSVRTLTEKR